MSYGDKGDSVRAGHFSQDLEFSDVQGLGDTCQSVTQIPILACPIDIGRLSINTKDKLDNPKNLMSAFNLPCDVP